VKAKFCIPVKLPEIFIRLQLIDTKKNAPFPFYPKFKVTKLKNLRKLNQYIEYIFGASDVCCLLLCSALSTSLLQYDIRNQCRFGKSRKSAASAFSTLSDRTTDGSSHSNSLVYVIKDCVFAMPIKM